MFVYLLKRAVTYVVMIFVTTSAAFFLATAFFHPGKDMESRSPRPSQEQINASLASLGLDPNRSAWDKYIDWLVGIFTRWDWGRSPNSQYVTHEFGTRVWVSTQLYGLAILLTLLIGVALGVYAASRQYKFGDRVITGYSYFTFIIPLPIAYFLIQQIAININNSAGQRIFYVTGSSSEGVEGFFPQLLDYGAHFVVPLFAITVFGWASYQVAQRQYLLDNINADFVRTARATGLSKNAAIRKHALRVSFIPVAQSIAFTVPAIFTGGFFAESIFAWHGIGKWSLEAILNQDVSVAVATVAFASVIFAIGAILADFATTIVDPRVRVS
ncbi:ABC transporter permease [Psychromicrobium lacuslunae]|uniref:ABC transporter permease n=1 Tax=Psychromicrobium lacuslunae TaxID=1618207 RepID=A0A0D4C0L8_9MICC|nr:ABC transporter permease [Psychromicrobium lacuslunae]AJT42084.1 ABC transporter permease [Psychromicrobium lacuslunae]